MQLTGTITLVKAYSAENVVPRALMVQHGSLTYILIVAMLMICVTDHWESKKTHVTISFWVIWCKKLSLH